MVSLNKATIIGQWSSWSRCSAECGGGNRYRTRQCSTGSCPTQRQACNTQDCQPEPELLGKTFLRTHYLLYVEQYFVL